MADRPGQRFEREVGELLQKLGWEIRLTPVTGDLGADVVAYCLDEIVVIQCKDWAGNAGYDAIKEVVAARVRYKAKFAVVVCNAGYTKQARDNAPEMDVLLYRTTDLSVGSFLDRSEQGKQHRALRAFQKQEEEREHAYNRLVADYMRYENAIAQNLACKKSKRERIWESLAALSIGTGGSILFDNLYAISFAGIYVVSKWIGADGPVTIPEKPNQQKPLGPFQRQSIPSFGAVLRPPNVQSSVKPLPISSIIASSEPTSPPMNGFGTLLFADGSKYVGDFKDGQRTGSGEYSWSDGGRYVGDFKDGKAHGYGTYLFADGSKYVGDFKDNQRTGSGEYSWSDGRKYTGQFLNGKMHGYGVLLGVDVRYEGEFVDDKYQGLGILYDSDGRSKYEGIFFEGEFIKKQIIKMDEIVLKEFFKTIEQDSFEMSSFNDLCNFYNFQDKDVLDYVFANRKRLLSPEYAYYLSRIYFAKIFNNEPFWLRDYLDINNWGHRIEYEDAPTEEDALYEIFWKEREYLKEYLFLSTSWGGHFNICALLILNLFRFDPIGPNFNKLFEAMDSPIYSNDPFISNIKNKLIILKSVYELGDAGRFSECHIYLDALIKVCDPDHPSFFKLSGDYERCTDPIIAACFLGFISFKDYSLADLGCNFRYFALGYNAYCNFIEYIFSASFFYTEKSVVSLFSEGVPLMITHDDQPMLVALDPDLLAIAVDEANPSEDNYVQYFRAFNFLYGVTADVDYQKARIGFLLIHKSSHERGTFWSESLILTGARYHLSHIYLNGLGVPVNIEHAHRFFFPRP